MTREAELADKYVAEQEKRLAGEAEPPIRDRALDADEVEGLLFELNGNVSAAAKRLGVRSDRLRAFILASGQLRRALDEVYEGAVDEAVEVLFTALRDSVSFQNRYYAAKEFLRSEAGRRRGFGREGSPQASLEVKDAGSGRTIVLKWIEPDKPKMIEGEKA